LKRVTLKAKLFQRTSTVYAIVLSPDKSINKAIETGLNPRYVSKRKKLIKKEKKDQETLFFSTSSFTSTSRN